MIYLNLTIDLPEMFLLRIFTKYITYKLFHKCLKKVAEPVRLCHHKSLGTYYLGISNLAEPHRVDGAYKLLAPRPFNS